MTVTVCQLHDHGRHLNAAWAALVSHILEVSSDLVLLPAMPFAVALPPVEHFHSRTWQKAVDRHERWGARLTELAPARVVGTRPVEIGHERFEEGFVYASGVQTAHANSRGYHPWFRGAVPDFAPVQVGPARVGFLIGPELWHTQESARYGREQIDLLVTPRTHSDPRPDAWLTAARAAARRSGAISLSSVHVNGDAPALGGWIMLGDGQLLGQTDEHHPFVSVRITVPQSASVTAHKHAVD